MTQCVFKYLICLLPFSGKVNLFINISSDIQMLIFTDVHMCNRTESYLTIKLGIQPQAIDAKSELIFPSNLEKRQQSTNTLSLERFG